MGLLPSGARKTDPATAGILTTLAATVLLRLSEPMTAFVISVIAILMLVRLKGEGVPYAPTPKDEHRPGRK